MKAIWTIAVLVLAGIYAPVLAEMAKIWWTDTYAAHGMFVVPFSAYLLWVDRDRLRRASSMANPVGLPVILLGLGVLAAGRWSGDLLLQGLSVAITVAGTILWYFGARCLREVAFPVGFLLFMAPLPHWAAEAVTLDLQLFAAGFAGAAMRLLDIPVYVSGMLIELPSMTLEVAEVCNGLRFLLALLVLTVAFAHVTQRSLQRKLIVAASAIPIAILANAVRVATISIGSYYIGPQVASGLIHHAIGKSVWALTLIPLAALGFVLRRGDRGARPEIAQPEEALGPKRALSGK